MQTINPQADSVWQIAFWALCALIVLVQAIGGYRKGFGVKCWLLFTLAAAYAAAVFGGGYLADVFAGWVRYPRLLLQAASGFVLALAVFAAMRALGRLIFRKFSNADKEAPPSRLPGAALGLVIAAALIYLLLWAVHFVGSVAELKITAYNQSVRDNPSLAAEKEPPNKTARIAASIKRSVEQTIGKKTLDGLSPVSEAQLRIMGKLIRLIDDPKALPRFKSTPQVRTLMAHPLIVALSNDQEVQRLLKERNYNALLQNEALIRVADSKEIQAYVLNADIESIIDGALKNP